MQYRTQSISSVFVLYRMRRATALLYTAVAMVVLIVFVSFAVDLARVQVVKMELSRAADAAARYGAVGLANGPEAAVQNAIQSASENAADGTPVVLDSSDIATGNWDATQSPKFSTSRTPLNAVQVTAARTVSRGNAVPLLFAQVVGRNTCDATEYSTATLNSGIDSVITVPATSNPWLAGMPDGTIANQVNPHNNPDHAKVKSKSSPNTGKGKGKSQANDLDEPDPTGQSPVPGYDIPIAGGLVLSFDSINGGATNDLNDPNRYTGDGNLAWVVDNMYGGGAENGKSDLWAPINAVVGVFLDDNQPDTEGATPSALDFTTPESRDFTNLSPQLRQPFFIGDGRTSGGVSQQFIAPQGATRLFIGIMDQYEWNNNVGSYTTTIHRVGTVSIVH
jgi:Flp pilus assembly protein TadG